MKTTEEIEKIILSDKPLLKKLYLIMNERAKRERKEYGGLLIDLLKEPEIAKYMREMECILPYFYSKSSERCVTRKDGSYKTGVRLLETEKGTVYFTDDKKLVMQTNGRNCEIKTYEGTIEEICKKENCKKMFIDVAKQISSGFTYSDRICNERIANEISKLSEQLGSPPPKHIIL